MGFLRGMVMFGRNLEWNSCLRNSCGEGLDLDKMIELSMVRVIVCVLCSNGLYIIQDLSV